MLVVYIRVVSCPGDFVSGAPPPTARLTRDLADWLGLSRVDHCFHYHRDSSLGHGRSDLAICPSAFHGGSRRASNKEELCLG